MERSKEKASLYGQMEVLIVDYFRITISMAMVSTSGQTVVSLKANGNQIKCMGVEFSLGPTVEYTKVNTSTTKKKEEETLNGQTAVSTWEIGRQASSMVKVSTFPPKVKREKASGKMEREWLGSNDVQLLISNQSWNIVITCLPTGVLLHTSLAFSLKLAQKVSVSLRVRKSSILTRSLALSLCSLMLADMSVRAVLKLSRINKMFRSLSKGTRSKV